VPEEVGRVETENVGTRTHEKEIRVTLIQKKEPGILGQQKKRRKPREETLEGTLSSDGKKKTHCGLNHVRKKENKNDCENA